VGKTIVTGLVVKIPLSCGVSLGPPDVHVAYEGAFAINGNIIS